jgi:tRNA/tmRNA/rRNA uracil-C5-methylase (TrmA/RlmC/RlmD family)
LRAEDLAKIEPFVPSPVVSGYRNKCEFSFGRHPFTGEMTVGFRLASYKKGSLAVVSVAHLPNVSEKVA